jgi:hypothetical protein
VPSGAYADTDTRHTIVQLASPEKREAAAGRSIINAMQLASSATLAEFPIEILLWEIPLNSYFAETVALILRRLVSAPPRSNAARHTAVNDQFSARHVTGRVRGEEQHPICDVSRLASPAERCSGSSHLVGIDRRDPAR